MSPLLTGIYFSPDLYTPNQSEPVNKLQTPPLSAANHWSPLCCQELFPSLINTYLLSSLSLTSAHPFLVVTRQQLSREGWQHTVSLAFVLTWSSLLSVVTNIYNLQFFQCYENSWQVLFHTYNFLEHIPRNENARLCVQQSCFHGKMSPD